LAAKRIQLTTLASTTWEISICIPLVKEIYTIKRFNDTIKIGTSVVRDFPSKFIDK
jgi:hypothetical protein